MANEALAPLGPLVGPDFLTISVNDETGRETQLEVYPDANNSQLKASRLPTHYYFVPQRIYLAKKQNSPADYDFGMTIFKGLMTSETDLGVAAAEAAGEDVETGGSFCVFLTTFAIPESVKARHFHCVYE